MNAGHPPGRRCGHQSGERFWPAPGGLCAGIKTLAAIVLIMAAIAAALQFVARRRSEDSQRIAKERSRSSGRTSVNPSKLQGNGREGQFFDQ